MTQIQNFINELKQKSDERYDRFKIEEIDSIENISDIAYIDKPVWLGGDKKFVCLFIDLDKSSKHSFKSQPKTMAKIYDYFTQNIVDVFYHPKIGADYIDIKGDSAFGIFEGNDASYKAFYCAITFKSLFENTIRKKFLLDGQEKLSCKIGIHKDKILVRKIGKRGVGNYNEVWAGRLVNNAAKLSNAASEIVFEYDHQNHIPILLSKDVYNDFEKNKQFGFYGCCDGHGNLSQYPQSIFQKHSHSNDDVLGSEFYYTTVNWCKIHADTYIERIN